MFKSETHLRKNVGRRGAKLALFIDEAHLIFKKASSALLNQIETIIKLIRSKGIGIFFVTQNPTDIPDEVLSQLGLKVQHALRAFTAKDRKAIKLAAENFPLTDYYDVDQSLTELGIGEALVSVLNEDGKPSPLVHTLMRAPISRMDILSEAELNYIVRSSELLEKYEKAIDRISAHEILSDKISHAKQLAEQEELRKQREKELETLRKSTSGSSRTRTYTTTRRRKSTLDRTIDNTARQFGRTLARELTRGLLGVLGSSNSRRRR